MTKTDIKTIYKAINKKLKRIPTVTDCHNFGLTRAMIRHHFCNLSTLQKACNIKPQETLLKETIYKTLGVKL